MLLTDTSMNYVILMLSAYRFFIPQHHFIPFFAKRFLDQ